MKFTNRKLQEEILGQTVCPGTPAYHKFQTMMMNYVREQEKEINSMLKEIGDSDPHPASFYSGQRAILKEILGVYTNKNLEKHNLSLGGKT